MMVLGERAVSYERGAPVERVHAVLAWPQVRLLFLLAEVMSSHNHIQVVLLVALLLLVPLAITYCRILGGGACL